MRLIYSDLQRPKRTAQLLWRLSPHITLPVLHDIIARAIGYRHWHDLSISLRSGAASPNPSFDQIAVIICMIAQPSGLMDGDVLYALDRGRLLAKSAWDLDVHLALRAALWRKHSFGRGGRDRPGTLIFVKGENRLAYLRAGPQGSNIFYDNGPGLCADREMRFPQITPNDFVPASLWLPYGVWRLNDGSEIAFSRDYMPLWRCHSGQVERLAPWLWIEGITDERHFHASPGPWSKGVARERAIAWLNERRVRGLPQLVESFPAMIIDRARLRQALDAIYRNSPPRRIPAYARLAHWVTLADAA